MNYYINETISGDPTAAIKARDDISFILKNKAGLIPLTLEYDFHIGVDKDIRSSLDKLKININVKRAWKKALRKLHKGDSLFIQMPVLQKPLLLALNLYMLRLKGCDIYFLIHDFEALRDAKNRNESLMWRLRSFVEEHLVLLQGDKYIVHNSRMKQRMVRAGFKPDTMAELQIFDYIIDDEDTGITSMPYEADKTEIIIAGNLMRYKSGYIYDLPGGLYFNLYGIGYEGKTDDYIRYHGAFPAEELPQKLKGKFGLIWDGDSTESCSGVYGDYLRYNDPHKASLYLACGIPVIIWREAALSELVEKEGCGLIIDSLSELKDKFDSMSQSEYIMLKDNAIRVGKSLRRGEYTLRALEKLYGKA